MQSLSTIGPLDFHIRIIGVLFICLALIHVIFPKYFLWKEELARLSLINRQMMIVHTFFIALVVFLMGILCLSSSTELANTVLGKRISLGFGIFWICRLFVQLFGYSRKLWQGKVFETGVHIVFTILWTYCSAVFILNYTN